MRILVAIDSFKGTLTSSQAGWAVARGLGSSIPDSQIEVLSVSDGGEGLIDAFHDTLGGEAVQLDCRGPLGEPVVATYLWLDETGPWQAVVEMASSCGLIVVPAPRRDIMASATWGVGEQLRSVLDRGARRIVVGAGGSATCDCGMGMLEALGARFFDGAGQLVAASGGHLRAVRSIDTSGFENRFARTRVVVASDVDNPPIGPTGAARTFAPQKGATPAQVELLEAGMESFLAVIEDELHVDLSSLSGGGAAGGLAAALVAFCGAEMASGFDTVAEALCLDERIARADLVVTGEGSMDHQTLMGKLPSGVARLAAARSKPVLAFCGQLHDREKLSPTPFRSIHDLASFAGSVREATQNARVVLEKLATSVGRDL